MFKIRQRNFFVITTVLIILSGIIILMTLGPELTSSNDQYWAQRVADCNIRLQYMESMYRARMEDIEILSQYLSVMQIGNATTTAPVLVNNNLNTTGQPLSYPKVLSFSNLLNSLSAETRHILLQSTPLRSRVHLRRKSNIRLPSVYNFLPHLLNDSSSLIPSFIRESKERRSDISIVLGIPTVKRIKQSYLLPTLQNLLDNMNEEERNETLIIVYIGETDFNTVQEMTHDISTNFKSYVDSGLIDVIAPSPSYYPNFEELRITLNDPLERVKWRSKQNLDFAYLMAYAQSKGTFYVQLEDDIMAKPNFITAMKKFAMRKSSSTKNDESNWLVLDFCQLGFIGKMFKSIELSYLITFFHMFYNDKPVDWLLTYFIETKVCRIDKDQRQCNQEKAKYWIHYKPSLFQHIGTSSSLKGKIQKLKDKQFGSKVPSFFAHADNPPAIINSNIAPYRNYLLKRAYRGETYFWGLQPQPGDLVEFIFEKPQLLQFFLFRSGNSEHPSDRFYNTTVEVQPITEIESSALSNLYNYTKDGFIVVGKFDSLGVATGYIDNKLGEIKEIRLHVHGESENWVLLSEIYLQANDMNKTDTDNKRINPHGS